MNISAEQNPFPLTGFHGPAFFCDRVNETKKLQSNAKNGVYTILLSERRMGKTGLLHTVVLMAINLKYYITGIIYYCTTPSLALTADALKKPRALPLILPL